MKKGKYLPLILTATLCCCYFFGFSQYRIIARTSAPDPNEDDRTFVRAELMPSFKDGAENFADTLKKQLLKTNKKFRKGELCLRVIVNKKGKAIEVQGTTTEESEPYPLEKEVASFILNTSDLWDPGMQNGYRINAFKSFCIEFKKEDLKVTDNK